MREWIFGRNPVYEVLRSQRRHLFQLLIAQNIQSKGRLDEILEMSDQIGLAVRRVPRGRLDEISSNHQGIALEVSSYPYCTLEEILELANQSQETPLLLILDTLQDPQNLGTLLRTAEAVGVHGVLLPYRRTATVTPAVVSASSGASEHVLITQTNLAQAIARLQSAGIWVVGLESDFEAISPDQVDLDGPLALVVGNEGQGLRRLVKKSCDLLMRLPVGGKVESLNASVAGSIALYLAWQARQYSDHQ